MTAEQLTFPEIEVLDILSHDPHRRRRLVRLVKGAATEQTRHGRGHNLSSGQVEIAINTLIENGFIVLINKIEIGKIIEHLNREKCFGPICGMPNTDCIDLTHQGGDALIQLDALSRQRDAKINSENDELLKVMHQDYYTSQTAYEDWHAIVEVWAKTEETARSQFSQMIQEFQMCRGNHFLSIQVDREIGRWRDRWWREPFEHGHYIRAMLCSDTLHA